MQRFFIALIVIVLGVGCATQPGYRRPIDPGAAMILNGYLQRQQYRQSPAPMVMPYQQAPTYGNGMVTPRHVPYVPPGPVYCTPSYDGMGGQVCR